MSKNLLYKTKYKINDCISIKIPTVREVIQNEDDYYSNIALIVATPYDMMVQLDDVKINFTTINDWDLFCLLFKELQTKDLSSIFDNLNLEDFEMVINKQNGDTVLLNEKTGAIIDRAIHNQICRLLREILHLEKNQKKPANEEARKFMIDRARRRLKRRKKHAQKSQLESYIISLVNTTEFPYNYNTVLDLTIYQFYASLHQIIKKTNYDNLMIGCYAGTINMKELNQKELDWLSN